MQAQEESPSATRVQVLIPVSQERGMEDVKKPSCADLLRLLVAVKATPLDSLVKLIRPAKYAAQGRKENHESNQMQGKRDASCKRTRMGH